MAFFGQLTANVQAQLNLVKPQLNSVLQTATRAKDNLVPMLNKATAQLDSLGKILQVSGDRKQSPIDIIPDITAYDPLFDEAEFSFKYPSVGQFKLANTGDCLRIYLGEDISGQFSANFLGDDQFVLEMILIHWGSEPMNGSEHTIGGVGYAGEIHFVHRNSKFTTFDVALKDPNGVLTVAVFLNESHDDNPALRSIIAGINQVAYKGSECAVQRVELNGFLPLADRMKEFWLYEGSETVAPFRETVKWLIFRSVVCISSQQLDQLRTLRKDGYESEVEQKMIPIRPVQPINGRIVRASFKSAAHAPPIER
ncbi:hypothetical protein AB6A40_009161 [Gnathostoma spinigerum]|uniref:Carbonic anhydrase n=1 Tax=Gnathostoma spinigerum TaxID=75299 RepID=A0ABD6ETJ6_9BILA